MSRILVVYGTTDGQTAKIATFIATTLRTRGFVVDLAAASQAGAPDGYSAVLASILERFLAQTGWRPDDTKMVAGALPYTRYNRLSDTS